MPKFLKKLFSRSVISLILVLLQLFVFVSVAIWLRDYSVYIQLFFIALSAIVIIQIIASKSESLQVKLPWIVLIALFPVFGILWYFLYSENNMRKKFIKNLSMQSYTIKEATGKINYVDNLKDESNIYRQSEYILNSCDMPLYQNTETTYFEIGEKFYDSLIDELKKAKKFIFIESFIVSKGYMLDTILDILKQKVDENVEVRFMFDDWGTIETLPYRFNKKFEDCGIKCVIFNPLIPILSFRHNNRDHKKIIIIDGNIAYTGGVNIADEYINRKERFGHWKDSGIMIKGEAVKSFTFMFLESWHYYKNREEDYRKYMPTTQGQTDGYVQPYIYNPMDEKPVARNVYVNILNEAKKYVYITTPYLIMDVELTNAVISAAHRGIDVEIITPHIPDKWYVHAVTKSFYNELLKAGVKIFEYTPGFIHAKNVICDDDVATIGTVNFDYRSLYHNYECGVWMYNTHIIQEMKNDFENTRDISMKITEELVSRTSLSQRLVQELLKFFSPML